MRQLIIKNDQVNNFVLDYWTKLKEIQTEINEEEQIYCPFAINFAAQNNLFFIDFLFHPIILKKRKFYELIQYNHDKQTLLNCINSVLEYELTSEKNLLSNEDLKKLIAYQKKLSKKLFKS